MCTKSKLFRGYYAYNDFLERCIFRKTPRRNIYDIFLFFYHPNIIRDNLMLFHNNKFKHKPVYNLIKIIFTEEEIIGEWVTSESPSRRALLQCTLDLLFRN